KQAILLHAARVGSAEGLEAVSLQRLASDLGMSKSGLFAHFGSKEELHMATIDAAAEIFADEVIRPALALPRGVGRVWALCERWMSYLERGVFPGGWFFWAVAAVHSRAPDINSTHIVHGMSVNSTSAPKMHIAAAPARRNAPGSSSHAEYHGGWTASPRPKARAAPKTSPAVRTAGAVSPNAH